MCPAELDVQPAVEELLFEGRGRDDGDLGVEGALVAELAVADLREEGVHVRVGAEDRRLEVERRSLQPQQRGEIPVHADDVVQRVLGVAGPQARRRVGGEEIEGEGVDRHAQIGQRLRRRAERAHPRRSRRCGDQTGNELRVDLLVDRAGRPGVGILCHRGAAGTHDAGRDPTDGETA